MEWNRKNERKPSLLPHPESGQSSLPSQSRCLEGGRGPLGGWKLHLIALLEIPVPCPFLRKTMDPTNMAGSPVLDLILSCLPLPTQGLWSRLPPAGGLGLPGSNAKVLALPAGPAAQTLQLPLSANCCCYLSLSVGISLPAISTKILSHSS